MRPEAQELSARFLPVEVHYPRIARWMQRVEAFNPKQVSVDLK
jgi:hypothetical protein